MLEKLEASLVDSASTRSAHPKRYYFLAILAVIYALNILDRSVFNVLMEPIKATFGLSDKTIGLIAGFGSVLFYSALGLPVARLSDRFNRRNIILIGLTFWGAMTVFCGLAKNAVALTLARVGVGIGETSSGPASQSIISDLFNKDERPRALGIYAAGGYLGIFLGYFVGGYVNQHFGWRVAFIVAGLPGIPVAMLLWLTTNEPNRYAPETQPVVEGLRSTLAFLVSQKSLVIVFIGWCIASCANYSHLIWTPSFLARVHHLSSQQIGTYAGTFAGLASMVGTLVGGAVVSYVGRFDDRWRVWTIAIAMGLAFPAWALCLFAQQFATMIVGLAIASFISGFMLTPVFAIVQTLGKPSMRATTFALVVLAAGCIGQGLGPFFVGLINDAIVGRLGSEAIRYSLLSTTSLYVVAAIFFVWSGAFVRSDIARAEQ